MAKDEISVVSEISEKETTAPNENDSSSESDSKSPKLTAIISLFVGKLAYLYANTSANIDKNISGAFLATADEAFVLVSYENIASHFERLSDGSLVLIAYTFGYAIALPVVRFAPFERPRPFPGPN